MALDLAEIFNLEPSKPSRQMQMALLLRALADFMGDEEDEDERDSIEDINPTGSIRVRPDFIPMGG